MPVVKFLLLFSFVDNHKISYIIQFYRKTGGNMAIKRFGLLVLLVLIAPVILVGQIIENPGKPLAKNAGRQIKITEVLRIVDQGGDFYFKSPYRLKAAPDGSIFVVDDKQFLEFNKDGKFLANLQKIGEGPGEYSDVYDFQVNDNRLLINTAVPHKILICDLSGGLIKEMRLNAALGPKRVLGIFKDKFYYIHYSIDFNKIKSGIKVFNQNLYVSTFDDKITDLKMNLTLRRYVEKIAIKGGGINIRMRNLDHFCFVLENEHSLYTSHTSRYLVKQVDLAAGKVIRQFTRKYQPIPYIPEEPERNRRSLKGFKKKYFSDITGISLYKGSIWVFTSTLDKQKGILVDLFNGEGKYLDNFYVPLPGIKRPDSLEGTRYTIVGDCLYIVEPDEEDTPTIVKYRIEI